MTHVDYNLFFWYLANVRGLQFTEVFEEGCDLLFMREVSLQTLCSSPDSSFVIRR